MSMMNGIDLWCHDSQSRLIRLAIENRSLYLQIHSLQNPNFRLPKTNSEEQMFRLREETERTFRQVTVGKRKS